MSEFDLPIDPAITIQAETSLVDPDQGRAGIHQDGRASGYVNPTLIPTSADPHPSPVGVD